MREKLQIQMMDKSTNIKQNNNISIWLELKVSDNRVDTFYWYNLNGNLLKPLNY